MTRSVSGGLLATGERGSLGVREGVKKNLDLQNLLFPLLFINISLEPVLRQGRQYRKMVLTRRCSGHAEYFIHFLYKKSSFKNRKGVDPPPPDR